jgi:3-isopropylmalate dehydrogenase
LVHLPWSAEHYLATGETMPADGYRMLRDEFSAIFVGALGDPRVPDNRHAREILLGTRFELDLYVNYRPVRLIDDRLCPLKDRTRKDINFVVFRENTEGVYVSIGGDSRRARSMKWRFRRRSTPTRVCTASSVMRSSTRRRRA